jgi:RecB family exonuclease
VITPRRTRLVRVADLHDFRRAIAALCAAPGEPEHRLVVVPTRGAARTLARTLANHGVEAERLPPLLTRDELYDALHARLASPPRRLGTFERDAIAQAAALEAARSVGDLPFQVRPGLVAELLRFHDHLRRQSQLVNRFEELITDALGGGDLDDRGADRLLRQTRFLAQAFRGYEQRVSDSGAVDEHLLRERLMADAGAVPLAHAIVTVPDWIADPAGLYVADFDLLNRLPNLAAIDIVATEAVLGSGFHERLHTWWPGIEEGAATELVERMPLVRPQLVCPEPRGDVAPLWFTHRDREEELLAVARRLTGTAAAALDRTAVVFKRPLPYLYLAADTLGAAGLPHLAVDALPLATEPAVATVDLVLDGLETDFSRDATIALLRSPHLTRPAGVTPESVSALDRALSDARYLGDPDRLAVLGTAWADAGGVADPGRERSVKTAARPALDRAMALAHELGALRSRRPASAQLRTMAEFLQTRLAPLDPGHPLYDREQRARAALMRILTDAADAHAAHHDPDWSVADVAAAIRRWIGDETFVQQEARCGIRLVDDQAARYGEFDDITIVGLVESEWPDRPRRNIFYPPTLLKALGWPSEKDRRAAADARFLDLLASAGARVELSTFLLDDEAIVSRSIQLDEVARARLTTVTRTLPSEPLLGDEAMALGEPDVDSVAPPQRDWFALRRGRTPGGDPAFHGAAGARPARTWSVSALETYIGCPFKFFAQHVLRLEEEPDDEEVMDPRRQGQFVHEVFESFFTEWHASGHREITPAKLPQARELFTAVVDRSLGRLPEGEAALERTRLLGSPAAAGLGEAVFRMEAERLVPVVDRLLERKLDGMFTIETEQGPRLVSLRGKADRIDLLGDGTFRLIDYKLGWPPDRSKALQLPIYAICAEQQLTARGRRWSVGEAMYLAFKGPKRVVPLFTPASRSEVLAKAQQRLADTIDAIDRGDFPPSPDDVYRCETCSFAAVCRKDYVGDV